MPAAITHFLFGRDVYHESFEWIGTTKAELDAFQLGTQGPDVFFYSNIDPFLSKSWNAGSQIHRMDGEQVIGSLLKAVDALDENERPCAFAYVCGFACHYILDSRMHPLIYAQEKQITSAGVEGLDDRDHHEVHAFIERDLDEHALYEKEGKTIADMRPAELLLSASPRTLDAISRLWSIAAPEVLGGPIESRSFKSSIRAFRIALRALYSPMGVKRSVISALERRFRRHSFLASMTHSSNPHEGSMFANSEHATWIDPFTKEDRQECFWDIYASSLDQAIALIGTMGTSREAVMDDALGNKDFRGLPTRAVIVSVETIPQA